MRRAPDAPVASRDAPPDAPALVLKVFHEEPAALGGPFVDQEGVSAQEPASASAFLDALRAPAPSARLYLTGTDLSTGSTGLTVLSSDAWAPALASLFDAPLWAYDGSCVLPSDPSVLPHLSAVRAFVFAHAAPSAGELAAATSPDRPGALRALLASGVTVLLPERTSDGHDLGVWAAVPLRAPFLDALRARPTPGVRRFAAPYVRMRSESKFYFERWGLDPLLAGVEEV